MERPPPCLVCYKLIEDVEKHLFEKHNYKIYYKYLILKNIY
jgi:hypothetical protein